jgi:predicted Zn-dependent protease
MRIFRKPPLRLGTQRQSRRRLSRGFQSIRTALKLGKQDFIHFPDRYPAWLKRIGSCFALKPVNRGHLWIAWGTILLSLGLSTILINAAPNVDQNFTMPQPRPHPLPATLTQWKPASNSEQYFDQIKASPAGYLIWSQFPVKVYVAPLPKGVLLKEHLWQAAIASAIQAWNPYLPLQLTTQEAQADIHIQGTPPKRRSGGRVRSAETQYEFYVSHRHTLAHRMTIYIRPNQTEAYIRAATRHEVGHALGLWGHSPNPQDTMYFSQVRTPANISPRDINTLKLIYNQPTQLGWPLSTSSTPDAREIGLASR